MIPWKQWTYKDFECTIYKCWEVTILDDNTCEPEYIWFLHKVKYPDGTEIIADISPYEPSSAKVDEWIESSLIGDKS